MKSTKIARVAAAMAAVLGFAGAASASVIDTFEDPPGPPGQKLVVDGLTTTAHSEFGPYSGTTSVIGQYRDLFIEYTGDGSAASTIQVSGGSLRLSNDSAAGSVGKVTWDGQGGTGDEIDDLAFGLNADLVDQDGCPVLGCDRFIASVLRSDGIFEYQIVVATDKSNYSILTAETLFEIPASAGPVVVDYLFEWFTRASGDYTDLGLDFNILKVGSGPDFGDVNALQLVINSQNVQDVDLQLDIVGKTGVPEPGTLALAGLALLGAGMARRRSQAKA